MKKMTLMVLCTIAAVLMSSCSENYGELDRIEPTPTPTDTTTTTKPDPTTPADTTGVDPFAWKDILAKTLGIDGDRQVESKIIAQRNNGEKDSTILRYTLGFKMSAPDTVRLTNPGTEMTAYTGLLSFPGKDYQPSTWQNCDSAVVVSTTKGYKTSYYNVVWETSHVEGWILFKGKMEAYKTSAETTSYSEPCLYKPAYEVVRNDSVYLREEVKNEVRMFFLTRTFTFEKKVVVDHFLKMKEAEKEPEDVNADEWVTGLGRMVSLTRGIREDNHTPCDFSLFEGDNGYTIIIDNYSTEGKYLSTETEFHGFDECPKTDEYDGVAYIRGHFYPGAITYSSKKSTEGSHDWLITCNIAGKGEQQRINGHEAVLQGIKNFKERNTAFPWPYLTNMSTSKEVNGKKVITVAGRTSEGRAVKQHIVADASLK